MAADRDCRGPVRAVGPHGPTSLILRPGGLPAPVDQPGGLHHAGWRDPRRCGIDQGYSGPGGLAGFTVQGGRAQMGAIAASTTASSARAARARAHKRTSGPVIRATTAGATSSGRTTRAGMVSAVATAGASEALAGRQPPSRG